MFDVELDDEGEVRRTPPKGFGRWVALILFLGAGAGAWWMFGRAPEVLVESVPEAEVALSPEPAAKKPPPPEQVTPKEEPKEPAVSPRAKDKRSLLVRLADDARNRRIKRWLKTNNIVQRVAAATYLVADGESPAAVLGFIRVSGRFKVVETKSDKIFISKANDRRYAWIPGVFTKKNALRFGRVYPKLRPHFDKVFSQIAASGERFDDVLARALQRLISVRIPKGRIELVPKGAVYAFKDPRLESLPDAEKHMIRIGRSNALAVQQALRHFVEAARLKVASPL